LINQKQNSFDDLVAIREAVETDYNFIFDCWRRSYAESEFAKKIPAQTFFLKHHRWIEKILHNAKVLIACSKDFPDEIRAWICFGEEEEEVRMNMKNHDATADVMPPVLHFCYVRGPFRKLGLASYMIKKAGLPKNSEVSHINDDGKWIVKGRIYNPYRFFHD